MTNPELGTAPEPQNATPGATSARATPSGRAGRRRRHRILVSLLLIIGTLLTPVTIVALFVHTEISDTSRYVQNVAPLASDPAIQAYVADDVTNRLFDNVGQGRVATYIRDALPPRAEPLVEPLRNAFRNFVHDAVLRVVQSPQFQQLWEQANRFAHAQINKVLTGEGTNVVVSSNGQVSIDLSALVTKVQQQLKDSGIALFDKLPIVAVGGKIPVFQSQDLYKARSAVGAFDKIAYLLPFLVFGSFGAAIWLSQNRRRGFLVSAICFALGAALLAILLAVGRGIYLDAATGGELPHDAAAAIYDTLVRFLHTSVRAALMFSIVVVLAVFFAGPSRLAAWYRTKVRATANWLGGESDRAGWGWLGPIPFVVRHKGTIRIVVAAIAFAVLFRWQHPSPAVIFWAAVITLAVLAIVEFFGREPLPAPEELHLDEHDRTAGRTPTPATTAH